MQINNGNFLSIEQLKDQYLNASKQNSVKVNENGQSFQDILTQKTQLIPGTEKTLKFSKHAINRLSDRNIELSDEQLKRLNDGSRRAGEKGIHDSLMLMDGYAFIVNVPNYTVITAMDQSETSENVFTNIDGAVVI